MSSSTRHSMVDAISAPAAGSKPPGHGRSSSFLGFSFRGRTHSSPSHPQGASTLPTVRENSERASIDEFGASRPTFSARTSTLANGSSGNDASGAPTMGSARQQPQQQAIQVVPTAGGSTSRQLHPEIRSVVALSTAQAHKIYFSGPLVKHVERHSDGRIVGKDEPWREVWAQLGGTTLSVWDMKEIEEANKRGAEVPPTYLNITDAVRQELLACIQTSNNLCSEYQRLRWGYNARARRPARKIRKRRYTYERWAQPHTIFVPFTPGPCLMDCSTAPRGIRKVASGRDLHGTSTADVSQ